MAGLKVVDPANAAFRLTCPNPSHPRRGIVLIHGLSDSPYHLRALARFFQDQGFAVEAPLLPGHATCPEDLLGVSWRDWDAEVVRAVDRLSGEVDELYLGGFSMGAALSVYRAARDFRIRGLFLFAPALAITPRARWAGLHAVLGKLWPELAWVNRHAEQDAHKYESFSKHAVAELWRLLQCLPKQPPRLPIFVAAAFEDATVEVAATRQFVEAARHPLRQLWWLTGQPEDIEPAPWQTVVDGRESARKIVSASHLAIVIAPDDLHYGVAGVYKSCLHYVPDSPEWSACQRGESLLGEALPAYLAQGVLCRLTYNPKFNEMTAALRQFIERLP